MIKLTFHKYSHSLTYASPTLINTAGKLWRQFEKIVKKVQLYKYLIHAQFWNKAHTSAHNLCTN